MSNFVQGVSDGHILSKKVLDISTDYVFGYFDYSRPSPKSDSSYDGAEGIEPNPTPLVHMYTELAIEIAKRGTPISTETVSMLGFRIINQVLEDEDIRTLEQIQDLDAVADIEDIFRSNNG